MKKFRKILLSALSLVLVVALTIVGTIAFLQDEDGEINVMTVGNVHITQHEKQFAADGVNYEDFVQNKDLYPVPDETLDNEKFQSVIEMAVLAPATNVVDKIVSVENWGKSEAYVRTVFAFEMGELTEAELKEVFVYRVNDDVWTWEEIGVSNINGAKYYVVVAEHNGAVESKTTTAPSLLQVFLKSYAGNDECEGIDGNENGTLDILTMSQAVQTVGFANATEALDKAFGDVTPTQNPWTDGAEYKVSTPEQLEVALSVGGTVTLTKDVEIDEAITIPSGIIAVLDLNKNELTGNILVENGGSLTVKNGTIDNADDSVSAIQANAGAKLVLENVEIESARHGVRVEGGEVVINGGIYKVDPTSAKTLHALNVSDGGKATINGGTFIGPKGTMADSGAAVNVQANSTVIINGGNFSGGKNSTLASNGTLIVNGGIFDQDPSAYTGENVVVETDGTWTVYPETDTWDGTADTSWYAVKLAAAKVEYKLYTAEQLAGLAKLVNEYGVSFANSTITLMVNVDLQNKAWTPIGNDTNNFQGTFVGKTISNLKVNMPGKNNVGLFGMTTNGEIKDVTVENADILGRLNVGVVAGTPYTSKYTNITVKGNVVVKGMSYVGGVGGKNAYANWTNIVVDVEDGSYVMAFSIENGTAYRTYVGGVVGFMGEGGHVVSNVKSNINVIGSTCDVGGIVGIAHYGNTFKNVECTGNVTITDATEAAEAEEIGGIAGVWNNGGSDVTFDNCKFTGTLSVNFTEGVNLKDNTIVGKSYNSTGKGKLYVNGALVTVNADLFIENLNTGKDVALSGDLTVSAGASNAYGKTGINVTNGQTIDGNGYDFGVTGANGTWDSAINITSGTLRNLTVSSGFRGIFVNHNGVGGLVTLENVIVDGTVYTISCDQGTGNGLKAINSTFNGWTSYAATIGNVEFVGCSFGAGRGYNFSRPYAPTTYVNCDFAEGHEIDPRAVVTFVNCTINGEDLTMDNLGTLVTANLQNVKFPVESSSAADLDAALNEGEYVVLGNDVSINANETTASSGYGATGLSVKGNTLDGNGNSFGINNWGTWDAAVHTTGGTIKNITINSGMRGIFMGSATADVYIDNVIIDGTIYTFNSDGGNKNYGVYISNSTLNGWTSHSDVHKEVVYTNCNFGEGEGYAFCRPYGPTEFVNCDFEAGFEVDCRGAVTFKNCTIGGQPLTAENLATLVTSNIQNATVIG